MKFVSTNEVNYSVNQSKQIRINSLKNTLHKNVDVRGYFNENEALDVANETDAGMVGTSRKGNICK